jgi:hypothetical protein
MEDGLARNHCFVHGVGSCYHKNDIIYWAHFSQSRLRKKEKVMEVISTCEATVHHLLPLKS